MADPKTVDAVKSFVSDPANHPAVVPAPAVDAGVTTVTDAAKKLGTDATEASAKIDAAIKEFNTIADKVKEYAGDAEKVGTELQGFSWIPGIGQGLQAIGGVLIAAGKAVTSIADIAEKDAAPIVKVCQEAADLLSKIGDDIGEFANVLIEADEEWHKAGEEFEKAAKEAEADLEKVATAVEKAAAGVVEEIEHLATVVADTVVEGWHEILSWFGGGHKKHAEKATHLVAQAKKQTEHLGTHGKALTGAEPDLTARLAAATAS